VDTRVSNPPPAAPMIPATAARKAALRFISPCAADGGRSSC
jgi:hypothetical protein